MRDYSKIDTYLNDLAKDIYPQEIDAVHTNQTRVIFYNWIAQLKSEVQMVLDVGCGKGVAFQFFKEFELDYRGITLGEEVSYHRDQRKDQNVNEMDMHFLSYGNNYFDLVYARHVLEHSPMPLLALMEWHRVSKKYCIVVVPHSENIHQGGINHYYMLNPIQWKVLFARSKWRVEKEDYSDPSEFRFLLIKE